MKLFGRIFGKNKVDSKTGEMIFKKIRKEDRLIRVRFPSMAGDTNRQMTIQELKEDYSDYLIFDPKAGEQVDLEKLANLEDIEEVVALPPISGG